MGEASNCESAAVYNFIPLELDVDGNRIDDFDAMTGLAVDEMIANADETKTDRNGSKMFRFGGQWLRFMEVEPE